MNMMYVVVFLCSRFPDLAANNIVVSMFFFDRSYLDEPGEIRFTGVDSPQIYTGNRLVGSANDATVGTHPLRNRGQFPIHLSHSGQEPVFPSQGSRSPTLRL